MGNTTPKLRDETKGENRKVKLTKPLIVLTALTPVAWLVRRFRSEQVVDAPTVATLVKLAGKPIFAWAAYRALGGRYLDRNRPSRGRFTRDQVDRILEQTWHNYDGLVPAAHVERLRTLGSRQNVLLGVASLGMCRALLGEGVEKMYATELFTDVAWKVYEKWIGLPRLIARRATGSPQAQMNLMLRMLLRYPFNRPGYQWQARPQSDRFALDIYRCPVYDYLQSQGADEFMLNSWCTLDFALAQAMTEGGYYERPHTLSAGDDVCDMKWYGERKAEVVA
jgi:hypothetical protein